MIFKKIVLLVSLLIVVLIALVVNYFYPAERPKHWFKDEVMDEYSQPQYTPDVDCGGYDCKG